MNFSNLKIIFTPPVRAKSFFKYKLAKIFLSGLVYKYNSSGCNATYCGKTRRDFKVQTCENLAISHLTGKKVKIDAGLCDKPVPNYLSINSFTVQDSC